MKDRRSFFLHLLHLSQLEVMEEERSDSATALLLQFIFPSSQERGVANTPSLTLGNHKERAAELNQLLHFLSLAGFSAIYSPREKWLLTCVIHAL